MGNMQQKTESFQRVMFQFETKLFLCDIHRISRVYFFEICIRNIGKFRHVFALCLGDLGIYELILMALELDESDFDEDSAGPKEEVAESVTLTLCQPEIARILSDYFSIEIDTNLRKLRCIPSLIDGYVPPLLCLPLFLFRLVANIEWFKGDNEEIEIDKALFKQIAMEIARFYQVRPPAFYVKIEEEKKKKKFGGYFEKKKESGNDKDKLGWIIKHVIFRSMNEKCSKYSFNPPRFLQNDGSIVQIA